MIQYIGKKVLITTAAWFYAGDGKQYRAVHGTLKAVHQAEKVIGFAPNRAHTNWFYEIGDMVIMGCQGLYIVCQEHPPLQKVTDSYFNDVDRKSTLYERESHIYITT